MTTLLAEAFFGQGFFRTMLFLMFAFLWGFALVDLARSHASGMAKAVWAIMIIVLPVIGALVYLATRPEFATETNPIDRPGFDPREREATSLEMTHRSSS